MIVHFCAEEAASIKSFAVKEKEQVKVTTRFLSRKMLMFAKFSLMSFIGEILETFCFPDKEVRDRCLIEKICIYHVLTDTGSTSLHFLFYKRPRKRHLRAKTSYSHGHSVRNIRAVLP